MYWMRKRLRRMAGATAVAGLVFWTLALFAPCCEAVATDHIERHAAALGADHHEGPAGSPGLSHCPVGLIALAATSDLDGPVIAKPTRVAVAVTGEPPPSADVARMLSIAAGPSRSPPVPALRRYLSTLRLRI